MSYDSRYKDRIFLIMCNIMVTYLLFFAFLHLFVTGWKEFARIIIFPLATLLLRWYLPRARKTVIVYHHLLVIILIHLYRLVHVGAVGGSNLFWFILFPMAPFLLLGAKGGFIYNIISLAGLWALISFPALLSNGFDYPLGMKIRFTFSYGAIALFAYYFERYRDDYHRQSLEYENNLLQVQGELLEARDSLIDLSYKDNLSSCYNRHYLNFHISSEIKRLKRYDRPLSLILCDLDHFKSINDTYGHQAGDDVIRRIGGIITESIRQDVDWPIRFGGEEFLLVLPETNEESAAIVAERIRKSCSREAYSRDDETFSVTMSCGVITQSSTAGWNGDFEKLVQLADNNLYKAKTTGRNKSICSSMNGKVS